MSVDFPRAWEIARATAPEYHDPNCSYRSTGGACLCDCHVLNQHPEATDDILQGRRGVPCANESEKHEIAKLRSCLSRIIRDAERAKKSQWITRADAIEHIMRLARYAEESLAS